MGSQSFWFIVYLGLLSLSIMGVIAAAYAFAIQLFLLSCLVLIGISFFKSK